ncbi:MAG TPA: DegT/DnrJ/EryC1/StrS family aminotransferase [Candidatus Angelobacter sp.]|nr:DegT/DnrJ/EryC1/StrS family aminotransferase [Candidatus Angelobacter sp.]
MTENVPFQTPTSVESESRTRGQPVRRIHLASPIIDAEMKAAAVSALENEMMVMGESVFKFEEEFAHYCGTKYAVSTASGTAALSVTFQALNIGHGSEVITTSFSFIATANSIVHAGADPIFADVEDSGMNLSPSKTRAKIGSKTRALMPVHLYGHPARISEFHDIAVESGLSLIEDACQAHGAEFNGRKIGSIGDAGCFSFYPAKNMTVGGDGGMITTNNEELADAARSIRDCGRDKNSKYYHGRIGFTSRLNTVNAAIGRIQLKRLEAWNQARRRLAERYRKELENVKEVILPPLEASIEKAVYHLFVIRTKLRDQVKNRLAENGIETGIHYPRPIHLQTPYRQGYGYAEGTFPRSESLSKEVLSLPMYPTLTDDELVRICEALKKSVVA